jgi:hypothetical protein
MPRRSRATLSAILTICDVVYDGLVAGNLHGEHIVHSELEQATALENIISAPIPKTL